MIIKLKLKDFDSIRINKIGSFKPALENAAKIFIKNYRSRILLGKGVRGVQEYNMPDNPEWIQRVKGGTVPLKHTGKLANGLKSKATQRSVIIGFKEISVKGGISGQPTSTLNKVAKRMQVGGKYSKVVMRYTDEPINISSFNVIPRPHFGATSKDRAEMKDTIIEHIDRYLKRGVISIRK